MWKKKCYARNKMSAVMNKNKNKNKTSVKFEVIDAGTPDFELGLRIYTSPTRSFGLIVDALKEAFATHVIHKSAMFLEISDYNRVLEILRPVCVVHNIDLKRIPVTIEAWFRGYKARNAVDGQEDPMDWERIPSKIRAAIFPYQKKGIEMAVRRNGRLFFADEMGLGKSLQSIATMAYFTTPQSKQLIVCPSYLRYNWRREIQTWTTIPVHTIAVVMKTKDAIDFDATPTVIISYDLAVRRVAELRKIPWTTVICDESHYIKNRKAQRTKALTPLLKRAPHVMLLSGTPALSRPSELFPQLHALFPRVFPTFSPFAFRYCDFKKSVFGWDSSGASNISELNIVLRSIMVRRLKKDVLTELPSKMRETLDVVLKKSEIREMQPLFDQLESLNQQLRAVTEATDDDRMKVFKRQSLVSELFRKTCAAKIPAVQEYVTNLVHASDNQHILFAHHHAMLDALEEVCIKANVQYVRIDGKTPQKRRQELVDTFRGDPQFRFAVLGLHACSTGLNFTPCRYMTFCETTWCPANLMQAEDRIHRIGAVGESVHYTYICAQGTLDERVYNKLAKKHALLDRMIDSGGNANGFDRTEARAFERDLTEDDPEGPSDVSDGLPPEVADWSRFGIHQPAALRIHPPDDMHDLDSFLERFAIQIPGDFVKDQLIHDLHPKSPLHDGHSLNQNSGGTWVNLSEYNGSIERFLKDRTVFLITDLALTDIIAAQRFDPDNVLDMICGLDGQIPAPSVQVFFAPRLRLCLHSSGHKRRKVSPFLSGSGGGVTVPKVKVM